MKIISYRYLPMNIYLGYAAFVLGGLFVGPIQYKALDYPVLFAYVSAVVVCFSIGYIVGARGVLERTASFSERKIAYAKYASLFRIALSLSCAGAAFQWYDFISSDGSLSLAHIGESYVEFYDGYVRGQAHVNFMYVLRIVEQALVLFVMLSCFYYYRAMSALDRVATVLVISTYLLIGVVSTGKQQYLGYVVIFFFYGLAINFAAKRKQIHLSTICAAGLAFVIVSMLFIEVLRQRYAALGITLHNIGEKSHALINWDQASPMLGLVSADYALALGIFLYYFNNGLYGLYLSLTLPFEWSYLIGNSYSLGRVVEIALGANGTILENTYPYRVGEVYGWGFDKWHSLFAWLASDISFWGVLALSPVFGFVYARLWLGAIRARNPFAGPLFVYFSLGLVFSFANNQIMHALAGVIVLLSLSIAWVVFGSFASECNRKCHDGSSLEL